MIQELFGGSNVSLINGERSKLSSNNTTNLNSVSSIFQHNSPSHSHSTTSNYNSPARHTTTSSSSTAAAAVSTTSAAANPTSENLRCPRCDSPNTKFCYYNNYNLTQPRHFCKTCRRYWTKGGALRNVPIGGGCRKNKNPNVSVAKSTSAAGKLIKAISPEIGMLRSSFSSSGMFMSSGFDQQHVDQYQNPMLWATSSQNSHLLSLLRANQNYNPNPNHNVLANHSQFGSESNLISCPMDLPMHTSASIGLSGIRNQQGQGIIQGEVHSRDGLQELYQRLRSPSSSSTSCFADSSKNNALAMLGKAPSSNFSSATTTNVPCNSTVLESGHAASSGEFCSFMDSKFSYF